MFGAGAVCRCQKCETKRFVINLVQEDPIGRPTRWRRGAVQTCDRALGFESRSMLGFTLHGQDDMNHSRATAGMMFGALKEGSNKGRAQKLKVTRQVDLPVWKR